MQKILVYGDSNVWGDNFITGKRLEDEKQWTNILQKEFKTKYKFIQEGLPGRIAGNYEQTKKYKNGQDSFITIFKTSAPLDKIIIALGTNDLQTKYHQTSTDIIKSLNWYKEQIIKEYEDEENKEKYFKNKQMPEFIYILPINIDYQNGAKDIFTEQSEKTRQEIINYFKKNSKDKIIYQNSMPLVEDGIHLNEQGHQEMAKYIREVLKND